MNTGETLQSALLYAYKLLTYRNRSEKEMIKRLRMKRYDEVDILSVISQLKANGFLDDRRLASSLKHHAEESKLLSVSATRRFLRERGIPPDIIRETIIENNDEEVARKLVEKKLAAWSKLRSPEDGIPLTDTTVRKLSGILQRRGYAPGIIKKALTSYALREEMK